MSGEVKPVKRLEKDLTGPEGKMGIKRMEDNGNQENIRAQLGAL
jgi:hypothetical protein